MKPLSPLGAIVRGLLAGAVGSLVQNRFFQATKSLAPPTPKDAFEPPEPQQREEHATETVARRAVEDFMRRGPLTEKQKRTAGEIVHYVFGALWGMVYALFAESRLRRGRPLAVTTFSSAVWMTSDNLILPSFRLAGRPQRYPAENHVYAWAAHLAYGASVAVIYGVLRRLTRGGRAT
jgi:hypothetical protein